MKPKLAVFKFASCDGCQLQVLNAGTELLALADAVDIAWFPEASSAGRPGPYDVGLVEGSVTTPDDVARLQRIRADVGYLIAIGACATSGGIQALRNRADVDEFKRAVYPRPEWLATLPTSTPVTEHVPVDLALPGCPVDRQQLFAVVRALLAGTRPLLPGHSVCLDCKRAGAACVVVTRAEPCLGPVTSTGCGAVCPRMGRGCYGCFGPAAAANLPALVAMFATLGISREDTARRLRGFTGNAAPFREASDGLA